MINRGSTRSISAPCRLQTTENCSWFLTLYFPATLRDYQVRGNDAVNLKVSKVTCLLTSSDCKERDSCRSWVSKDKMKGNSDWKNMTWTTPQLESWAHGSIEFVSTLEFEEDGANGRKWKPPGFRGKNGITQHDFEHSRWHGWSLACFWSSVCTHYFLLVSNERRICVVPQTK